MPSKKNMEKVVTNPLGNRNVGRRTGKDIKAGKNIRKIAGGFENFDDYWSESEADMTREATFVKPSSPMEATTKKRGDPLDAPSQPSLAEPPEKQSNHLSSVLVQSQIGNIPPVNNALNPLMNKQIGRRTGKDMKAGKTIRVLDNGFENFDDYWSESETESIASFCTTSSNKSKAERPSSKSASNTSAVEKKSAVSQQRSRSSGMGENSVTDKSRLDQEKPVTSIPDQEVCTDSTAPGSQASMSSSEAVDSQENDTVSREVTSQEEDSQEDRGHAETAIRHSRDPRNVHGALEEEHDKEKTIGEKQRRSNNISNPEKQKQGQVSDKRENLTNKKHQRKSLGSSNFSESRTNNISDTDQPSTSTKERTTRTSKQECTTSAEEQPSSSARKRAHKSSTRSQRNPSGKKESQVANNMSEAQESRVKTAQEISDAREVEAGEGIAVSDRNEESEEEEQSCKDTVQKEIVSSCTGKKLPSASKDSGSKEKLKEGKQVKPGVSQQSSVSGSSGRDKQKSTSNQNATGISYSQISSTESPQPMSQKSSVYLSVAGDVTGSITRLSNGSVLSPEPKLYGTRRRLSYTESPGKDQQPKTKIGTKKSRVPVPLSKTSWKVVSSPIPEDHKESAEEKERDMIPPSKPQHTEKGSGLSSQSDDGETDPEAPRQPKSRAQDPASHLQSDSPEKNKIPHSQPVAKNNPTPKRSSGMLKRNSILKDVQQNSQEDSEQSQSSVSKGGMFVSLINQTQTRPNTVSAVASQSDSDDDDDGFEIVNESKVYRVLTNHPKPTKNGKERAKNPSQRKKDLPVEEDKNHSPQQDESQPGKTKRAAPSKKIAERKSLSSNEADIKQISADTQAQVKKRKAGKNNGDEHESAKAEDIDSRSEDKKSRKEKGEKNISVKNRQRSASQESQGPSSTDTPEEEEAASKKSRTVGKKKASTDNPVSVSSPMKSKQKSPAIKEKQQKKKKSLQKSAAVLNTGEDDDENSPQAVHKKIADGNKPKKSRKSNVQKAKEDNACTTDNELLLRETTADSKSETRRKPERKTVKSRTRSNTEDEPLMEETAADSDRAVRKTKKTKTQTKVGKQPAAEGSPVVQEQRKSTRSKRPRKSETNMTTSKQLEESVKSSKRKKRTSSSAAHGMSPAKNMRRASAAVEQDDMGDLTENEAEAVQSTPGGESLADMSMSDSALKSGISFRHFSHLTSSLKTRRSQQLMRSAAGAVEDDIISSPALGSASHPHLSSGASPQLQRSSRPAGILDTTPVGGYLSSRVTGNSAQRRKKRRVTISENVTHHSISPPEMDRGGEESMMPSMSTTPVHYYQLTTPSPVSEMPWTENKIVHPDGTTTGLRRSQRTRVKPLEWYKNERIIYDRRRSGPVIMGVEPSREHIYLEQENQKRRRRRQKYLVSRKQQSTQGRLKKRRLSTHVDLPDNLDTTVSTDIPVVLPDTQEEVLMSCFNPAVKAPTIGPGGGSPLPDDPFSLKLITQQSLFTTGTLTLAPASEKPLQRTMSTAVLYFITYGKILVTINRATTILESGDHFFVPRGTVYRLKNLRKEEASLSFANLMVDQEDSAH